MGISTNPNSILTLTGNHKNEKSNKQEIFNQRNKFISSLVLMNNKINCVVIQEFDNKKGNRKDI